METVLVPDTRQQGCPVTLFFARTQEGKHKRALIEVLGKIYTILIE